MSINTQTITKRPIIGSSQFVSYVVVLIMSLLMLGIISAAKVGALTPISQGFTATKTIASGSIVSLKSGTSDQVVTSTAKEASAVFGVVISSDSSLLSLNNGQANQVQVATSGTVPVLVSDINGGIKDGDAITASGIDGVGMKATINTKIIGVAQEDLNANNSSNETYKDNDGTHHLQVGLVSVLVNVAYYYKQPEKTIIPTAVQNVANAIAGKKVDSVPILISSGIFLVTLFVVATIIYAMIRSSIISVGRNPMSQAAVYRDVMQMSALVVGIIGAAVVSIYLVLTRFS
jgi:hypothetical protein